MPLSVNLRHLSNDDLSLEGELPAAELDIAVTDELVRVGRPLEYDFTVQKLDSSLLLQGRLLLVLDCECARCLKKFEYPLELADWVCDVPLEGEEKAPIVSDCVDLTPYIREDILLQFPQHPLCDPKCSGLRKPTTGKAKPGKNDSKSDMSSAWAELDKLKLK